jgi:hypothetical protein
MAYPTGWCSQFVSLARREFANMTRNPFDVSARYAAEFWFVDSTVIVSDAGGPWTCYHQSLCIIKDFQKINNVIISNRGTEKLQCH